MPEWRMLVWQPDGTARATINVDGPVARLDRFDVNGAGNCLEASWIADPQSVTIKARDVIRLDAREEATDAWTSVYKGFVTIAGSSRAESLQDYRAVGLKQRFYEILLEEAVIDGADVATMADQAFTSIAFTLPEGVPYSGSDMPTLNFELGDRYPALETVGDFLDALAGTVGRFIVPTGETYTYDGTTYNAGDIVPAVKWGTKADGTFFFRRPQAASVSINEGDTGVLVRWERTSGEEVYDNVTLVYASKYKDVNAYQFRGGGGGEEPIPHVIARTFGTGIYKATRRHVLTAPLDYMTDDATLWVDTNVTNPANAFDGDDLTYAQFGTGGGVSEIEAIVNGKDGVIARVVFEKAVAAEPLDIEVAWVSGPGLPVWIYQYDDVDDNKYTAILPMPVAANLGHTDSEDIIVSVVTDNAQGAKIYSIEMFVPDVDLGGTASEKAAEGYEQAIDTNASEVELVGQLGAVSQTMTLTPTDETATDVTIERVEFSLSNDEGLITRYLLGQSFSADLLSEAVVLRRLAKKDAS